MGNGREPTGTSEQLGDLGGSKGGTNCDGWRWRSLESFEYVKRRDETEDRKTSCQNEDGGEALRFRWKNTVRMDVKAYKIREE